MKKWEPRHESDWDRLSAPRPHIASAMRGYPVRKARPIFGFFGFITPMEGYPEFSVPTLETCVIDSPSRVRRTLTLLLAQAV